MSLCKIEDCLDADVPEFLADCLHPLEQSTTTFWNPLIWLKKKPNQFNSWNLNPAGSINTGPVRPLYQHSITDFLYKSISQLPLGIWEKQLPVEDYQDATDNVPPALEGKVALIKNSFYEPECPSCCCWLISKLDRPIDVKREEQKQFSLSKTFYRVAQCFVAINWPFQG